MMIEDNTLKVLHVFLIASLMMKETHWLKTTALKFGNRFIVLSNPMYGE
jgi:predicted secreted acid phosphatase